MAHLIDKDALVAEIEKRVAALKIECDRSKRPQFTLIGKVGGLELCLSLINTLEVKEVDLKKLGEIARHLIAVKNHIEDMRLDSNEWLLLEKIGYLEQFKAKQPIH